MLVTLTWLPFPLLSAILQPSLRALAAQLLKVLARQVDDNIEERPGKDQNRYNSSHLLPDVGDHVC